MYEKMTDDELDNIRKSMPKYLNDMTPKQIETSNQVYAEQKKRYDAIIEKYNLEVEAAGYKVGDKVSSFAVSMLGFGGVTVTGTVAKRKRYYVKLTTPFNGQKSAHLTKAWKKE